MTKKPVFKVYIDTLWLYEPVPLNNVQGISNKTIDSETLKNLKFYSTDKEIKNNAKNIQKT